MINQNSTRFMLRVILWVLTGARVFVLVPFFLQAGITAHELARAGADYSTQRALTVGLIVLMGVTDLLDGWVARRFGLVSQLGAVVDAVSDKLVQIVLVCFFSLIIGPAFTTLPLWFLIVVFGRDLVLLVGVTMLRVRYGPLRVVHQNHGRISSLLMFGVVTWSALGLPAFGLLPLMLITAAISVYSAVVYAFDGAAQGRAKSRG